MIHENNVFVDKISPKHGPKKNRRSRSRKVRRVQR